MKAVNTEFIILCSLQAWGIADDMKWRCLSPSRHVLFTFIPSSYDNDIEQLYQHYAVAFST